MTAMRSITNFDANGLYTGEGVINFSQYNSQTDCLWTVKLVGDNFVPYPNIPTAPRRLRTCRSTAAGWRGPGYQPDRASPGNADPVRRKTR